MVVGGRSAQRGRVEEGEQAGERSGEPVDLVAAVEGELAALSEPLGGLPVGLIRR